MIVRHEIFYAWYFVHMNNSTSSIHLQVGKNIQAFRKKHRFSLLDLSQQTGIDKKRLESIEKGTVNIRLTTLIRLMAIIGPDLLSPNLTAK